MILALMEQNQSKWLERCCGLLRAVQKVAINSTDDEGSFTSPRDPCCRVGLGLNFFMVSKPPPSPQARVWLFFCSVALVEWGWGTAGLEFPRLGQLS